MENRGKTIVYIDNSNIFQGQRDKGWRIDAKKLIQEMEKNGKIWQTHFFAAVTDPPRFSQTEFYKMLKEQLRWETHLFPLGTKSLYCKECNKTRKTFTEKGVDVAIATKMLAHAMNKAYETAILVSGDKDYLETVQIIKNLGLRVEVVSFRHSLSKDLANESSAPVLFLDDVKKEIEFAKSITEIDKFIP
jgi:uncharacterized LabA/DUF88 family protein